MSSPTGPSNLPAAKVVTVKIVGLVVFPQDVDEDDYNSLGAAEVLFSPAATRQIDTCCAYYSNGALKLVGGSTHLSSVESRAEPRGLALPRMGAQTWAPAIAAADRAIRPVSVALGRVRRAGRAVAALRGPSGDRSATAPARRRDGSAPGPRCRAGDDDGRRRRRHHRRGLRRRPPRRRRLHRPVAAVPARARAAGLSRGRRRRCNGGRSRASLPWSSCSPGSPSSRRTGSISVSAAVSGGWSAVPRRGRAWRRHPASPFPRSPASVSPSIRATGTPSRSGRPCWAQRLPSSWSSATVVFSASLNNLVTHPNLYGWNWNYALLSGFSGDEDLPAQQSARLLAHDHYVTAASGVYFAKAKIDGTIFPIIGASLHAPVAPPLLSGHGLRAPNQIVLGGETLALLGKHVGDTVELSGGTGSPTRLTIVGTATLPAARRSGNGRRRRHRLPVDPTCDPQHAGQRGARAQRVLHPDQRPSVAGPAVAREDLGDDQQSELTEPRFGRRGDRRAATRGDRGLPLHRGDPGGARGEPGRSGPHSPSAPPWWRRSAADGGIWPS